MFLAECRTESIMDLGSVSWASDKNSLNIDVEKDFVTESLVFSERAGRLSRYTYTSEMFLYIRP